MKIIELPIVVGDKVTVINQFGEIVKCTVAALSLSCNKKGEWKNNMIAIEITDKKDPWQYYCSFDDIGKTVFICEPES